MLVPCLRHVTQPIHELCSNLFTCTAIDNFVHLLSQGQEHGFVSLGWAFHIMLANLSEGISHKGDWFSSYSIKGRSDDEFILSSLLSLLWVSFLVSSLSCLHSLSCLLLLRSWGNKCISKAQGLELVLGWLTATHHVAACRLSRAGRRPR